MISKISRQKSKALAFLFYFLAVICAHAQTARSITGTVYDTEGLTLLGATVTVKGTSNGTTTDLDGKFQLQVDDSATTLVVSYLGYQTQEFPITENSMSITLQPSTDTLDEIVIVGYGGIKKGDITGAVSIVDVEDATAIPSTNVSELLRGRAAGVQVDAVDLRPGGNSNIIIRGQTTVAGIDANNPLIIVDGVPYDNINDIAPEDIESIQVLKDASSQAIYGARAGNGVIVVTTKRGSSNKLQVNYSGYTTTQRLSKNFDLYSGEEFAQLRREAQRTSNTINPGEFVPDVDIFEPFEFEALQNGDFVDWEDLLLEDAVLNSQTISISGGGENTKVYTSLNYFNQDGLIPTSGFERGTFRLNVDQKISNKLSFQANVNIQRSKQDIESNSLNFITISPLARPFDENGELVKFPLGESSNVVSPLWNIRESTNELRTNLRDLNIVGIYDILPNLTYRLNLFSRARDSEQGIYRSSLHSSGDGDIRGLGTIRNLNYSEYLIENQLDYKPVTTTKHKVDLTFVHSINERKTNITSITKSGFANDRLGFNGPADVVRDNDRAVIRRRILGFLGRARYNYLDKYLMTLTARVDASSVFGENNKYGFFPAAELGWKIDRESFLSNVKEIDQLKLRASYGLIGNEGINPRESLGVADFLPFTFGGVTTGGFGAANRLPNPNLKWEQSANLNLGLDFGFFNNWVNGSLEVYQTNTTDLLLDRDISGVNGFNRIRTNIGEVENKGVELTVNTSIVRNDDFKWSAGIIYTQNRNRILSLDGSRDEDGALLDLPNQGLFIGESINSINQFVFDGIFQTDEEIANSAQADDGPDDDEVIVGDIRVLDLNDDGIINDDDRRVISQDPDFLGSFNTTITYKGFELYADIYIVEGATRINNFLSQFENGGTLQGAINGIKVPFFTPENPSNEFARPRASTPRFLTAAAVKDASYQRLRTVTLGYNFQPVLLDKIGLRSAKIYATGTNLITLTDFRSYSPEQNAGAFPDAKALTLGLRVGF